MVNFGNRARGWIARFGNSLLRADWHPAAGASREWPAALRRNGALPAGRRTPGAGCGIYSRRDSAVVLRVCAIHSDFRAMENDRGAENAGVGCQDQTDPKHARASEEAASLLRV